MIRIPLSNGHCAIVDDMDADRLRGYKWCAGKSRKRIYAMATVYRPQKKTVYMHCLLMEKPKGTFIDHANGNGLDNRRENLRIATRSQNQANRGVPRNNTSGLKGVYWQESHRGWKAAIYVNRKRIHAGLFKDKNDAGRAYDALAIEHYGEFAYLNFPKQP